VHHIRALSQGGTDDLDNLTHLCRFHHELAHQLSFAMDGGFNWIRSPFARYADQA
jgi:predicted restriction endonuclease